MTRTWTISKIPMIQNKRERSHHMVLYRDAQSWKQWVRVRCGLPNYSEPQGKVRVKITVYRGKPQDPGNREGSVKPVVDALVKNGWLRDDTSEWIDLTVEERVAKKPDRRTVIELEDGIEEDS